MYIDIIKVILPAALSFIVGIIITPIVTHFLYKYQMWKKSSGKIAITGEEAKIFNSIHQETENKTPRMGGIVIWMSVLIVTLGIWILSFLFDSSFSKFEFVSRTQTWIPLATLLLGAIFGMIDDLLEIRGSLSRKAGGLSLKFRLAFVGIIGLLVSWWFHVKLDVSTINLPFGEALNLGWLIIPIFTIIIIIIYSGGIIDGVDGLSGGIFATMFGAYSVIAYSLGQTNLAALSGAIMGGILAFLWFNIPPARFYMSETGSMGLTITISVIAFMTDSTLGGGIGLFVLPIIALPLIATTLSVIVQLFSKKIRGKKIFLSAPLHHHFEAIGWPSYKVTMRYWIIGVFCSIVGVILALMA